tara:strand:- start:6029 stop:6568 length:540 start_codon:yes stop_codon:yes gene_type:complete
MSLEENIKNEIRLWSKEALEKPNENYNNMPACPFAKRAWVDDRVGFIFKRDESFDVLFEAIYGWDNRKDVVILIDFNYLDADDLYHFMDMLNQSLSEDGIDMFVMGFHPESDENELLENSLEMTDDNSYAMIFLQRLTKLQEASNVLREKGYYDVCQDYYENEPLYELRAELYRRLRYG